MGGVRRSVWRPVSALGGPREARRPGCQRPASGDHLEATIDPGIRTRQAAVATPPGFADAIGWLGPVDSEEEPHWHVTFTVADRDQAAAAAERLGGTVLARADSGWTRDAVICDPQGGVFTASQFTPPSA